MSPARKPAKKTSKRKTVKKKAASKASPRKKPAARKPAAKKPTTRKTSKKTASKKSTSRTPAKKTARKLTAKSTARKKTAKKPAPKKTAAKKTTAKKTTAKGTAKSKKTTGTGAAPRKATFRPSPPPPARRPPPAPKPRRVRPAKFDKKDLAEIKAQLVSERGDLERQVKDLEEESFQATQSDMTGEVGLDDDFADAGSATFDRENALSIGNNIRDLISQIDNAIRRIEEGSYGTCERCGRPIDAARLKALPHASLCMDCKRREERIR